MVYAVSAVHRDSILRFARFQFPPPSAGFSLLLPRCLLFSRSASVSLQDASTRGIFVLHQLCPSVKTVSYQPSRLFYLLSLCSLPNSDITGARKYIFPITGARKYIFLCFRILILISEKVYKYQLLNKKDKDKKLSLRYFYLIG